MINLTEQQLRDLDCILNNKISYLEKDLVNILSSDMNNVAIRIKFLKVEIKIKRYKKRIKENKMLMEKIKNG